MGLDSNLDFASYEEGGGINALTPAPSLPPSHQLLCALLGTPKGTLRAREHMQAAPQCRGQERGSAAGLGSGSVICSGDVTV